jgi:hypothetical protein
MRACPRFAAGAVSAERRKRCTASDRQPRRRRAPAPGSRRDLACRDAEAPLSLQAFDARAHEPTRFIEYGVNMPFAMSIMPGAEVRPRRGQGGMEPAFATPSGGEGCLIIPWSGLPRDRIAPTPNRCGKRRTWPRGARCAEGAVHHGLVLLLIAATEDPASGLLSPDARGARSRAQGNRHPLTLPRHPSLPAISRGPALTPRRSEAHGRGSARSTSWSRSAHAPRRGRCRCLPTGSRTR